ncbi:MAG: hypothetical protein MJB57_04005 [Gemmatimonadetes bacterium]|nr:hypothetical protein [Gemmatimonadota bacterium]
MIGALLLLHFGFHPMWTRWTVGPDLLAGGVLLGSLLLRAGQAAILGFVLGLLEASMALGPLGPTMLVLATAGFAGAWLRDIFYSDSGRFVPIFLFLGVWILQIVLTSIAGNPVPSSLVLLWGPGSAALTTLVCWALERFVEVFLE